MDNGDRGMPLPTYLTSISNKNEGLIISDISEEENEEGSGGDSDDDDDAVLNLNEAFQQVQNERSGRESFVIRNRFFWRIRVRTCGANSREGRVVRLS